MRRHATQPWPPIRPNDARVWLSPEAPAGDRRGRAARAAASSWRASAPTRSSGTATSISAPEQVPLARSLLRDDVRWVQLDSAGVEAWFEHGLVDDARVWTSAAGAYAVAVAEHILALRAGRGQAAARGRALDDLAEARARGPAARRQHGRHRRSGRHRPRGDPPAGAVRRAHPRAHALGPRRPGCRPLARPGRSRRPARRERLRRALRAPDARDRGADRSARARADRARRRRS